MISLATMQRVAAMLFITFWGFFFVDHSDLTPAVVDFERCFVVPDLLFITPALLFASVRRSAVASAAAGGAMIFLGLLDAGFNAMHGQYEGWRGVLNVFINLACVAFGAYSLKAVK